MNAGSAPVKEYRRWLIRWGILCGAVQCALIYGILLWSMRHGLQLFTPPKYDWYDAPVLYLLMGAGPALYIIGALRITRRPEIRSAGISRGRMAFMVTGWLILGDVLIGIALFLASITVIEWAETVLP